MPFTSDIQQPDFSAGALTLRSVTESNRDPPWDSDDTDSTLFKSSSGGHMELMAA